MMIITRFRNEMLFSQEIRAIRLNSSLGDEPASHLYKPQYGGSCRLPSPSRGAFQLDRQYLLDTYSDATAWPIFSVLYNIVLNDILETKNGTREVHGFCLYENPEIHLRYCKACAQEQREQFAVSWWMRDLNLPLVAVCPIHEIALCRAVANEVLKNQWLPHELLARCRAPGGHATEHVLRIAKKVIDLCRYSALIDSDAVFDCVKWSTREFNRRTATSFVRDQLGVFSKVLHPASQLNIGEGHNGLTSGYTDDYMLIALVFGKGEISDLFYRSSSRAAVTGLISLTEVDDAIEEILAFATTNTVRPTIQALTTFCKIRFQRRHELSSCCGACIEFSLLHWLDARWIQQNISVADIDDGYDLLSDAQVRSVIYLLQQVVRRSAADLENYILSTWQRTIHLVGKGKVPRDPEIQDLIKRDRYIPQWGETHLGTCATYAPVFARSLRSKL